MAETTDVSMVCNVCGAKPDGWIYKAIISDALALAWHLSSDQQQQFSRRESQFCPACGNSARTRILAQAIMQAYPFPNVTTLTEWVEKANAVQLTVAEINACGKLHQVLARLSHLAYSEYPSAKLLTRVYNIVKRIRTEDITRLTYKANSFDLVLHSEVLEHVPDVKKAIRECRRTLKPNGICLFTVPYIATRKTKQCADINKRTGRIVHLKKPSYHGLDQRQDNLVWWEFGHDFLQTYNLKVFHYDQQLATYVFAMQK